MPADCAASSRLMPSSALAIARMRRAMRASLSALASLCSTLGVRSRRIDSADMLPSSESITEGDHEPDLDGIPQRPQESGVPSDGITPQSLFRPAPIDESLPELLGIDLPCCSGMRSPLLA